PAHDRDPEFSSPQHQGRLIELDHAPESYLRLVANPFLAASAGLAWLWFLFHVVAEFVSMRSPFTPVVALVMVGLLALIVPLFQYHCLDCGATGRLSRWRRHICMVSASRRERGRPRRLRGPSPPAQVVLWFWFVLTAGILATWAARS